MFLTDLAAAIDRLEPLGAELFSGDRIGHGVAPDGRRAIAGSDVPTPGARPDRHRRRAPDHLTGVPRHPCGVGRAPARTGRRWPSRDAPGRASRSPAGAPPVQLLEIGPLELAIDEREAVGLGRELGLRLPAEAATRLTRETEGWPALLALAMLGASGRLRGADRIDAGTDHLIDDYLRSEVLERRSAAEITFLTRTSILDQLPAPLCDVVADRQGSDRCPAAAWQARRC